MSETEPGADELRVRQMLVKNGVGPDADPEPPAVPSRPADRPRDWLDDLLDEPATPAEEAAEPEGKPQPEAPARPKKPQTSDAQKARKRKRRQATRRNPDTPRSAWDTDIHDPRQSLLDAWNQIPYRLKWLACHAIATGVGWHFGLVTWATNAAAWFAAGHWTSTSAWVLYVFAGLLAALYRVARKWAWPLRLVASIPIASTIVGVLLYGTGYHR